MKLWGGRFKDSQNDKMKSFNSSFEIDKRLYKEDIEGSIAHVNMLGYCSIIPEDEAKKIALGLSEILHEIQTGTIKLEGDYEDIHTFIEFELIKKIGEVGKKLHTGRSRNDQVALDSRLFARKISKKIAKSLDMLIIALEAKGKEHKNIMPGYTHLQRAQVVTLEYYLCAYVEMFKRDYSRIRDCMSRLNENPLGAGALAGTTHEINRRFTTKYLEFENECTNFMDAVSDRDYMIELVSNLSIVMMHLSRLSEELIIWSSQEFNFIKLSDAFSTGSSIMPQKKNPDAPELIRGKTGVVYGDLMALLTMMKGLPLAYNKDMQEDKGLLFDACDQTLACLSIMTEVITTLIVNEHVMAQAVKKGFLNATEVADYLVGKGLEFRNAHRVVGEIVIYAEEQNLNLEEISLEQLKTFSQLFTEDIYGYIDYNNILAKGNKKEILNCKD